MINITEQKLKKIVKESVKEAMKTEFMKLRAFGVPEISKAEQVDIEKRYKKPSRHLVEIRKVNL
ncbi:MAG: hypothetical protein A2908_00180 [Candidatus Staskawiczbacteria bacterium RIFCSPLOWO2_01_FULL_38_12b]|uniref:Uncharacterized protein n=1 Tax=Candidatus Staskawiczbacteria bacterium RIFCSPLOWO2_01_FULL_38_12b TaxID=1802214 RepID=A0A1G2IDH9_9BACT|nr:MAG: hypothetical protein A2908_00180 [Candidatus Staskawiczbacteria bacterium RIFCSPLOWO2_01_FULL_38_12b]